MAVMAREAWTDQRLDDLNERIAGIERRVETGFASMQSEFKGVRDEMNAGFKSVREEMQAGFKEAAAESVSIRRDMADQFSAQNRMIMQLAGGMFATMIVGFLGTIATILVTA
jgi:hypothetical protein